MTFNISSTCNLNCVFCSGYPKEKLDLEKDILSKIKGLHTISLQGGEPTLSPYIFDIIDYARNNGTKYINLITNGLLIANEEYARKISGNIDCYQFAFPSHIASKADILGGKTNVLKQKMKALFNLCKLGEGRKIRIVHLVQNENIEDLISFPYFINKYYPDIKLIEFKYIQYFDNKNNIGRIPKYSDVEDILNKAFSLSKKLGINIIINGVPLCFLKEDLHPYTSTYNNKIIEKELYIYSTIKLDKCKKCKYSNHCIGVRNDYLMFYGNEEFK